MSRPLVLFLACMASGCTKPEAAQAPQSVAVMIPKPGHLPAEAPSDKDARMKAWLEYGQIIDRYHVLEPYMNRYLDLADEHQNLSGDWKLERILAVSYSTRECELLRMDFLIQLLNAALYTTQVHALAATLGSDILRALAGEPLHEAALRQKLDDFESRIGLIRRMIKELDHQHTQIVACEPYVMMPTP